MYSQADYEANPSKYKLFSTAVLSFSLDDPQFKAGDHVAIKFVARAANAAAYGAPVMPLYEISKGDHVYAARVYASALQDFDVLVYHTDRQ